jgi:S1-C subfamily serine protease
VQFVPLKSSAFEAGIRAGDNIVAVNGESINRNDPDPARAMRRRLNSATQGETISITYVDGETGTARTVSIQITKQRQLLNDR